MGALTGLPGTNGKPRDVAFFRSVAGALNLLARDRATTTAGDEGAINIWLDDAGEYRGCRSRYMQTMAEIVVPTKAQLKRWLIDELPKIYALAHDEPEETK
jgi:hypothetical protein